MKTAQELASELRELVDLHTQAYDVCELSAAMLRQQAEQIEQLGRWKSTHAPRIAALEGLLATTQRQASTSREAAQMLESGRQANSILTDENEVLKADAERQDAKIKALRDSLNWALSNISEEPYEWSSEEDADAHNAAIAAAKE